MLNLSKSKKIIRILKPSIRLLRTEDLSALGHNFLVTPVGFSDLSHSFETVILSDLPSNSILRYLHPVDTGDVSGSTLIDRSGNGWDATVNSGPPIAVPSGSVGQAIDVVQASSQRITINPSAVASNWTTRTNGFSGVWHVKGGAGSNPIVLWSAVRTTPFVQGGFVGYIDTDGSIEVEFFSNDLGSYNLSYTAAPAGTVDLSNWSDIVLVVYPYSGTFGFAPGRRIVIYVNGSKVSDEFLVYGTDMVDSNGLLIGQYLATPGYGGLYDELAWWAENNTSNACFSDAQAVTIHALRLAGIPLRTYLGL